MNAFACGGNSAPTATLPMDTPGSGIYSLSVPEQISYVTAQETGTSSSLTNFLVNSYAVPTEGQYISDEPEYFVYEESMQTLDIVNNILCSIKQTRYDLMVNEGTYTALVNYDLCNQSSSESSSTNQSSGQEINYEKWVVTSERETESSDQIVSFWILQNPVNTSETGDGTSGSPDSMSEMRAKLTISSDSDDSNPFGVFHLDMIGYNDDGPSGLEGYLSAKADDENSQTIIQLELTMTESEEAFTQTVHAVLDNASDSGSAASSQSFGSFTSTALVAFNSDYYHSTIETEGFDTSTQCLDRDDFITSVWGYNLYDDTGSLVEVNSGFPITDSDDNFGYASYYGIWLSNDDLTDGMKVYDSNENEYATLIGGGRLLKRTKYTKELSEVTNELFLYWDYNTSTYYKIKWNGTNLVKVAIEVCETSCQFEDMTEAALYFSPYDYISLWKDGFGHYSMIVPYEGLSDTTNIFHFEQETISPDDLEEPLTLYCYINCPMPNPTATELESGEIYVDTYAGFLLGNYHTYVFDPTTYMLTYADEDVTVDSSVEVSSTAYYSWGFQSGNMVTTLLDEVQDIHGIDVAYVWETGPNDSNKYISLLDSTGDMVDFEQPLDCAYDDDTYGAYQLDYNGPGELYGIPSELNENENTNFQHWTSLFTIPNGAELSCDDGNTYYSKAMSVEQFMQNVATSNCADLSLPTTLNEVEDLYADPELDTAPATDEPVIVGGQPVEAESE